MTLTIRGVDVFDPSTGAVRTGDTDDVACWFIDTDYFDLPRSGKIAVKVINHFGDEVLKVYAVA